MSKVDKPLSKEIVGTVEISNTQQFRVEIVDTGGGKEYERIAIQKWWRENTEHDWKPSKGVFPTKEQAEQLLSHLQVALDTMK